MGDKPISAWFASGVFFGLVCLTLMMVGSIEDSHTLQNWGIVAAAAAIICFMGGFCSRNCQAVRAAMLLRRDADREGVVPMHRGPW